jgi:photosystem II stability/assembly factor-like uncharacterized protein
MKTQPYLLLTGILLWLLPFTGRSQPDALGSMLAGKTTYDGITATFNSYFDTAAKTEENFKLRKHFSRWAYYQSMHLGPGKEFVNVSKKNLAAVEGQQTDAPQGSANGSWTFVGPSSTTYGNTWAKYQGLGRGDRIAFHPTNASIIYVGTPNGGLWRSSDGGSTWTPLSNFIPSLGVSGIVVSHAYPNTIYVLTGDGDAMISNAFVYEAGYVQLSAGVLVSYDAGVTWQQTGPLSSGDYVGYRLIQHPTDANILIAATSDGIYRTTNGGDTWVQEATGKFYDVEFKPGTPSTVYASGVGLFRYSTNTGDTWNSDATFNYALCSKRVEIAVTPDVPNKVYLFAAPKGGGNNFCGFFVSTNSGTSFARLTNVPNILGTETGSGDQSEYDMGVTVKPTDDQIVITGGLIVYKSTNGGTSFTNATFYNESGTPYIHPDIHYVAYNPLNNYLYAASDGGFHRSTDDGATWTDLYNGLNVSQFYHFDDYDAGPNTIAAGCQDNGMKYRTTNTGSFYHCACCDAAEQAILYTDNTKGYCAMNDNVFYFANYLSNSVSTIATSSFFPQIELNSSDPTICYYSFNTVVKYDFDLNTKTQLGDNSIHGAWILRTCPSNALRIYAGGGTWFAASTGSLFLTNDGGTNWSTISGNTGFPAAGFPRIADVEVCPVNSSYVWAAFSGYIAGDKVVYSYDAGANWVNISYDLPNVPVWSLSVDNDFNVYAGTEIGIFFWAWGSTHWEPFNNQMPNVPVSDLAINYANDQLLAATFGRGIWKSGLHTVCPTDLTIVSNVSGYYFSSASNSITMMADAVGGNGTDVNLRAGSYVDLIPGFRANGDEENKFRAYLGPCGSGMPPDYSGPLPIYPDELSGYEFSLARNLGTLQLDPNPSSDQRELTIRLFGEGVKARVILASATGQYISDISNFEGSAGEYPAVIDASGLSNGLYYLYLIVNDKVMHLQEMQIGN